MNRNPYAPPDTQVADPEQRVAPIEKPRTVVLAVRLLWISLVLSLAGMAVSWRTIAAASGVPAGMEAYAAGTVVGTAVMTALFSLWCIWKLNQGRNWMRILYLVIQVLGILMFPYQKIPALGAVAGTTSVLTYLMQIAALVLIYLPASRPWFQKRT